MSNSRRPSAFYHRDGLVAAWTFASRYNGDSGHIATLPEIVELRLGANAGTPESPWDHWYTSSSAEYIGVGADDRIKIIVAHGVGPMSTIDGIKAAYKWEWGDKTRRNRGGRITAQEFLDLEAGKYGKAKELGVRDLQRTDGGYVREYDIPAVSVLDFQDYLDVFSRRAFHAYLNSGSALRNPLLWMRLGPSAYRYVIALEKITTAFHSEKRPNSGKQRERWRDDVSHPYVMWVETASNCAYLQPNEQTRLTTGNWVYEPRVPEDGYALGHLLDLDALTSQHTSEVGVVLVSSPNVHEWWNGARFIAVPPGALLDSGLANGPDAARVIRENWLDFMEEVQDDYVPITPYRLESTPGGWFTRYPKKSPGGECMDDSDVEFRVRTVKQVGKDGSFTAGEDFFLRYALSQIKALMPGEANSYEIVNIRAKDRNGMTTVTVRFYVADVDTSRRLPRTDVIARDYDRLMEAWMKN